MMSLRRRNRELDVRVEFVGEENAMCICICFFKVDFGFVSGGRHGAWSQTDGIAMP